VEAFHLEIAHARMTFNRKAFKVSRRLSAVQASHTENRPFRPFNGPLCEKVG
jgi:hypothetical protein